jgi:hypothetical protein
MIEKREKIPEKQRFGDVKTKYTQNTAVDRYGSSIMRNDGLNVSNSRCMQQDSDEVIQRLGNYTVTRNALAGRLLHETVYYTNAD